MKRNLVIPGTDAVGALLVDILLGRALRVRATTREKWKAGDRGPIAWVYLDFASGEGIEQAFAAVDRTFIAIPPEIGNPHEALAPLVAEAKRRRLEKIVLLTPLASDGTPVRRCELEVERSGLRYEIMRAQPGDDPRMLALAAARLLTRDDLGNHPLKPGAPPPRLRAA